MVLRITGGSLIQGTIPGVPKPGGANDARNLEAVILSRNRSDFDLFHYWRDQVRPDGPWRRGALITGAATGPGAPCQRRMVGQTHGNFEVLVPERDGVVHY